MLMTCPNNMRVGPARKSALPASVVNKGVSPRKALAMQAPGHKVKASDV